MVKLSGFVRRLFVEDAGATMLEYGFMATLIAVVCAVAVGSLGTSVSGLFTGATPLFAG